MSAPLAAALAFFAFGVLFAGTAMILLLAPDGRGVRWWALFQGVSLVWLGAQGWSHAAGASPELSRVLDGAVHLLPAFFVAFALVDGHRRPTRDALLAVALGVFTLPLAVGDPAGLRVGLLSAAWHVVLWSAGTVLLTRGHSREPWGPGVDRRLARAVVAMLVVVAPLSLVGGVLLGPRMWLYAMPLLVVWIQLLVFVGVTRLRFYDVEVRARRTGELAADAAEQERFAVLGELSASLAHEIRNPLTGVRSLAQRLAEDTVDEPRRRRYAQVILEEVGRVERLVTNLLGVARRPARGPVQGSTPLEELFDDLLLLLGARAEKAGVRLTADAQRLAAATAREPLAQALLNLLFNAVALTPEGGTVELLARREAGEVRVLVRDEGPGVPEPLRERIWEPFFTGGSGTGLGLAVVRRLARQQGWAVEVGDAPGGGAEFALRIPEAPPAEAGGDHRSPLAGLSSGREG